MAFGADMEGWRTQQSCPEPMRGVESIQCFRVWWSGRGLGLLTLTCCCSVPTAHLPCLCAPFKFLLLSFSPALSLFLATGCTVNLNHLLDYLKFFYYHFMLGMYVCSSLVPCAFSNCAGALLFILCMPPDTAQSPC